MSATFRGTGLREVRGRWNRERDTDTVLRVALLSTYTIDPLVPYLGTALRDAGLPAAITVGPSNQVVQQCLDDASETARTAPDVLVVAPRFEELSPGADGDLVTLAEATLAAALRWRACLVFVLPPLPDGPNLGLVSGSAVPAISARERVRRTLGAQAGVYVADAETVVRGIGSRHAHHRSLYEYARIPYVEEVYAGIADIVCRLLRMRFGTPCRAVIVDADELLFDDTGTARPESAEVAARLGELHDAGTTVALRSGRPPSVALRGFAGALGPQWTEMIDDWAVDDRPRLEQVAELAAADGLTVDEVVVLAGAVPTDQVPARSVVVLDGSATRWADCVPATGLFDGTEVFAEEPLVVDDGAARPTDPSATLSLEQYVAGLNVVVSWRPADRQDVAKLHEMVLRTKDFALGRTFTEAEIADWLTGGSVEVAIAEVTDRLGDYGIGAALAVRFAAEAAAGTVELLLVSCPVLGKGVEAAVLHKAREMAIDRGRSQLRFRYQDTGRNGPALTFLRARCDVDESGPDVGDVADSDSVLTVPVRRLPLEV